MAFHCDPKTLERLEWPRLAECLAREALTPRGQEACRGNLFAASRAESRERLAETDEARALLDAGVELPFAGVHDLRQTLSDAALGGLLRASCVAEVLNTLAAARRLGGLLAGQSELAPRLASLCQSLPNLRELERVIAGVVTPEGEIRDDASPELRRLSRQVRRLEGQIQERMNSALRAPGVQPYLQDHFVTLRENRPVLPIRADCRQHVRGIVHDVSSSGTTVFIEPEAVVELSNQLRIARTERDHELERLLREVGEAIQSELPALTSLGDVLETLDVVRARGRLSRLLDACAPETGDGGPLRLLQIRHPLLLLEAGLSPDEVIPNDVALPAEARGLVISGPNAGGKTVIAKAVGLAALSLRAGLHVSCAEGSSLPLMDRVAADIGDEQDLRSGLSTFSARMSNLAAILADADAHTLVILDEVGEGTEPGEGASLAQAILETLVGSGARVIATTHFNRLKELAGGDPRFLNASAEFDPTTLLPTYHLRLGDPGSSGAIWVAQRMGLEGDVIERARGLLDDDDRQLEALTQGLFELRRELEAERRSAASTREASESARQAYEERLATLRDAREKALSAMKQDLEVAFRRAQDEIADVMREVQRGSPVSGRSASRAQERLSEIREETRAVEEIHREPAPVRNFDAAELRVGTRIRLVDISGEATVMEPPDRRGRVAVRAGGLRMVVPLDRVEGVVAPHSPSRGPGRVNVSLEPEAETLEIACDLRGLRVDEALERAEAHLLHMRANGIHEVRLIHGHGTGALREAIRSWLRELEWIRSFSRAPQELGGDGVTIATLSS